MRQHLIWPTYKLKDISEIVTGNTPESENAKLYGVDIPFVTPSDLDSGKPIFKTKRSLSNLGAKESRLLPPDSVLVCCIGATIGKIGFAGTNLTTNQQINSLILNKKIAHPKFVYYYCYKIKPMLLLQTSSTTLPIINKTEFSNLPIPLPPLPEQRRIAAILEQADELRQLQREADEKAEKLLPALFDEMFGDPVTNPKHWPKISIGDLLHSPPHYGTFTSSKETGKYLNLRVLNIVEERLELSNCKYVDIDQKDYARFRVYDGDVLLARAIGSASLLGKCAVYRGNRIDIVFDSHLMRLQFNFNKIIPEYFHACFTSVGGKKLLSQYSRNSSIQFNVNTKEIKSIAIPVPPYEKQFEFLKKSEKIRQNYLDHYLATIQVNNLFQSLLSQAFTGELTATWREKHADELAKAAQERDELLAKQKIGLTPSVKTVQPISQLTLGQYQRLVKEKYLEVAKVMANSTDTANMLWDTRVGLMIEFIKFLLNPPNHREPILEEVIENALESWSIEQIKRLMSNTLPILAKGYQEYGAKLMGLDGEVGVLRREIIEMTAKTARRFFCDWLYSKFLTELKSSEEQHKVYQAAISETKYFTSESLTEKIDSLSSTFVKHSLELFEAVGLIMKVSIPSYVTGEVRFVSAYRALWLKDIKLDDESVDNKNYDSLDGSKIESL